MFNIFSHQGNKSKSKFTEIPSHTSQNNYHQKENIKQQMLMRMQVEKKALYIACGNVN
jgi:hypothetical protein